MENKSTVYRVIMSMWAKCQKYLSPVQSPLSSFIYHPAFGKAVCNADFWRWEQAGLDILGKLGLEARLITEEQVIQKMGIFPDQRSQFIQIRHFFSFTDQKNKCFSSSGTS